MPGLVYSEVQQAESLALACQLLKCSQLINPFCGCFPASSHMSVNKEYIMVCPCLPVSPLIITKLNKCTSVHPFHATIYLIILCFQVSNTKYKWTNKSYFHYRYPANTYTSTPYIAVSTSVKGLSNSSNTAEVGITCHVLACTQLQLSVSFHTLTSVFAYYVKVQTKDESCFKMTDRTARVKCAPKWVQTACQ